MDDKDGTQPESSPGPSEETTVEQPASTPGEAAPSDSATDKPQDVEKQPEEKAIDVVQAAIDLHRPKAPSDASAPSTDTAESQEKSDKVAAAPAGDQPTDDAILAAARQLAGEKNLGTIARFQELVDENKRLKPIAENMVRLNQAIHDLGGDPKEWADFFAFPIHFSSNPTDAISKMEEWIEAAKRAVGLSLPPDLAKRVEDGLLDEASAKELAEARGKAEVSERREARTVESVQLQAKNAIVTAVNSYEKTLLETDPDYIRKAPLVRDRLAVLAATKGQPSTVEGAKAMAEQAYADVNKQLKAMLPARSSTAKQPASRRVINATPAAKSPLEAVNQALARVHGS